MCVCTFMRACLCVCVGEGNVGVGLCLCKTKFVEIPLAAPDQKLPLGSEKSSCYLFINSLANLKLEETIF